MTGCAGEEKKLWELMIYALPEQLQRVFGPDTEAVSLGCVWTSEQAHMWWKIWQDNAKRAHDDGQTLVVFSRRKWKERTEKSDVNVSGADNKSCPLVPPIGLCLKKGEPIKEYGTAQEYEIEWLKSTFKDRVVYLEVEKLDPLRTLRSDGSTYEGAYDPFTSEFDGKGTKTWPSGSVYAGEWKQGKRHGEGMYARVAGDVSSHRPVGRRQEARLGHRPRSRFLAQRL